MRLALELQRRDREALIVNADASQVYRDIPIISAQPTEAERMGLAHALFGHVDASEACSAAAWADEARGCIADAHCRDVTPILVGGTGLYITTLLNGIAPVPTIPAAVREEVRALPPAAAHAALQTEDPAAAARFSANDRTRVMRALEVVRGTGRPLSHWQGERRGGIAGSVTLFPLILTPPREWLVPRIRTRIDAMWAAGALAEAVTLDSRKLDTALPAMRAIGVRDLIEVARGSIAVDEGLERIALATRRYVKRQDTWLRHQPPADWPRFADPGTYDAAVAPLADALVDLARSDP